MGNYQQYGTIWINFTHIILSKISHKHTHTHTHTHTHQDVIQIWYKDTQNKSMLLEIREEVTLTDGVTGRKEKPL